MPTETGRHRLYEKVKGQWGEEDAAELMSYLPPVGWADVATKHDLDTQTALLRAETAKLGSDLRAEMEKGFAGQLRWIFSAVVAMTVIFSIIVTIAR